MANEPLNEPLKEAAKPQVNESAKQPATIADPTSTVPTAIYRSRGIGDVFTWPTRSSESEDAVESSLIIQVDGGVDANASSVSALLTTSSVIRQAAKNSLGLDTVAARSQLEVISSSCGPRMTRIDVRLKTSKGKPWKLDDADKFLQSLVESLNGVLQESTNARLNVENQERGQIEKELAVATGKLRESQRVKQKLNDMLKDLPPSYRQPEYASTHATSMLENSEQELEQLKQQLVAFEPALKAFSEKEELIKLRREKVEQLKKDKKPDAEIKEAQLQLAETEDSLESMRNSQARSGRVEITEGRRVEARIKSIQKKIELTKTAMAIFDSKEFRDLSEQQRSGAQTEHFIQSAINELNSRKENIDRQYRRVPPIRVTVLDGVPDEEASKVGSPAPKE